MFFLNATLVLIGARCLGARYFFGKPEETSVSSCELGCLYMWGLSKRMLSHTQMANIESIPQIPPV